MPLTTSVTRHVVQQLRHRLKPLVAIVLMMVAACGESDDGVTISGDVGGLDTIGLRVDAATQRAERLTRQMDSIRRAGDSALAVAVASGNGTLELPTSLPAAPTDSSGAGASAPKRSPLESRIAARSAARGDSLARAVAERLANGSSLGGRARSDTVRGVVTVVGDDKARQVVLRSATGNISLSGLATSGLSRLSGTEIMVRGVKVTPRDIVMSDFLVRAVDGVPAYDGILESGAMLRLTDGSGRKQLPSLPAALRGLEGARVWVAIRDGSDRAERYGIVPRR